MKRLLFFTLALILFTPVFAQLDTTVVRQAMQDELLRTQKNLKAPGFQSPYFISYTMVDSRGYEILAAMGAVVKNEPHDRYIDADVNIRVGSPKFDNSGYSGFYSEQSYKINMQPGTGYDTIRHAFWALSDLEYKDAVEQLERKKAYRQKKHITEIYDDFSKVKVQQIEEKKETQVFDADLYADIIKEMSAVGKSYKHLKKFNVKINFFDRDVYYLDTEKTWYKNSKISARIILNASLQTADGFEINDNSEMVYASLSEIPSKEELLEKAKKFASGMEEFYTAKKMTPYIGPVLFENGAAATLLNRWFLPNISRTKPYWIEEGEDNGAGKFRNSLGLPVISHIFNVVDDPLMAYYGDTKLAGTYAIDDEGAPAEKVELVKNGRLVNLLTTRSLTKGQTASNGHGRGLWGFARAMPSNIFFLPSVTVPANELKDKLIEKCKELGLEYCVRVERMGDTLNVYKVYTESGKEEAAYGAELINMSTKLLRAIEYAGDDIRVYNTHRLSAPASIIAPSFIVGDIEIMPTEVKPVKKPYVSKP
ncbi:putative Zn-dependent protease-like protein [Parelusimicrobium proximum]|uniref:metallopeptidase TldD-related protein n=1 Tax=Parelusimicrobium proximum TaxID=3228953 RepID=UPI003D16B949